MKGQKSSRIDRLNQVIEQLIHQMQQQDQAIRWMLANGNFPKTGEEKKEEEVKEDKKLEL